MPMTLIIPFDFGEKVYVVNEYKNKSTKKHEYVILEGIVECVHIGRKLKYGKYFEDSYIKCRSTNIHALLPPISLKHAEQYVFKTREEAESKINYWKQQEE